MKKQQQKIEMILTSKKIDFEKIDVAASEGDKEKMRALSGNPKALPPQLFNGDQYCGVSYIPPLKSGKAGACLVTKYPSRKSPYFGDFLLGYLDVPGFQPMLASVI